MFTILLISKDAASEQQSAGAVQDTRDNFPQTDKYICV